MATALFPTFIFLGLVDPSRNRLVSTAFQKKTVRLQCFACVGQTFFFSNIITILFFKTRQIYMKVQNRLNRKKNQISDISNIYFSSYNHFCSKNCQFSMNFHTSRNKNRKIVFLFVSSHCATFMKVGSKLRVGRSALCMSLVGTGHI